MQLSKELPLVSVIVPLYNSSDYITETLQSVLNQTYQNIEIIVVDHASTDNSYDVVSEIFNHEDNMFLIKCDVNLGGPAHPRNKGIEASNGEYIAFLDSDDIWERNKIEAQMSYALNFKNNFICCNATYIDETSKVIKKHNSSLIKKLKKIKIKDQLFRNQILTSSLLLKKELLEGLNFDESHELIACEDIYLWLEILNNKNCNPIIMSENLLRLRVRANSLGSINGKKIFAAKYMLASLKFLIKSYNIKYIYVVITSFIIRSIKISFSPFK